MDTEEIEKTKKAGEIAKQAVEYARSMIKAGMPLLEIAEKIEAKIIELGGKPAFPVNLSINEIAAHSTPSFDDKGIAGDLLKVDIGVSIDGYVGDTAFSVDLSGSNKTSEENKKLIKAAEKALEKAIGMIRLNVELREIGSIIEKAIVQDGFQPIRNLSGHRIERYDLHAGLTIPNFDNSSAVEINEGIYAIEPFATNGAGAVRDGKPSGIYHLKKEGNVRDNFDRQVLKFINEEYKTLPFCSRWIHKKFGTRGILALKRIEEAGLLHHYSQLIERGNGKVAQAEHTIVLTKEGKVVATG